MLNNWGTIKYDISDSKGLFDLKHWEYIRISKSLGNIFILHLLDIHLKKRNKKKSFEQECNDISKALTANLIKEIKI